MTPISPGHHIIIPGAGLVGSLAGIWLSRLGFRATLLDKRSKPGTPGYDQSRSINLALSHRGWKALGEIGVHVDIGPVALPMEGRIVHDLEGRTQFQPYGRAGQAIYSVSRSNLNRVLNERASAEPGVEIHYRTRATSIDIDRHQVVAETPEGHRTYHGDAILSCDGAFSAMRQAFQTSDRFDFSQDYIAHGYQEFHMEPNAAGDWAMDPNGLHIWPRKSFMMIALPNPDKSFTCTLFLAWEGSEDSFAALKDAGYARMWLQDNFPDFCARVPDFAEQARKNVVSSLVTIRCFPWYKQRSLLLGDAAHAIVPFYGQGMNAGFEDVDILMHMLPKAKTWEGLFMDFAKARKPDTDAIADLALANFVEMRDKVADPLFLFQKKIDARLAALLPERWVPLYTMVSFTSTPYSEAWARGREQERLIRRIMDLPGVDESYMQDEWLLDALSRVEFGMAISR